MAESKLRFELSNHDGSKVTLKRAIVLFAFAAITVSIFGISVYILIAANKN